MSDMLQEWWMTEAFGTRYNHSPVMSQEDKKAMEIMERTTKKIEGRYETGLLWRDDDVKLPDSRGMALCRLEALQRSLVREPEKAKAYQSVIDSYLERGHARKLEQEEADEWNCKTWLLPHHAVTNPHKPGKLRVVFDAAAQFNGVSLNSELLTGPDLMRNLTGVLLRFRQKDIALVADIQELFHQVKVLPQDQTALRFLWRELDKGRKLDVYQMTVTIFGAKSSPASANYVLQKTAKEHCQEDSSDNQAALTAVMENFYMDDFLYSSDTVSEAKAMQQEVSRLLSAGGFRLTKWNSNSLEVLASISKEVVADQEPSLKSQTVLGCVWEPEADTLSLRPVEASVPDSKRGVVKGVARLFDPLGIASPFILRAKLLVQQLWIRGCGWDEPFMPEELATWHDWLTDLGVLPGLHIPRVLSIKMDVQGGQNEVHVFCDASQRAFAAVAYFRYAENGGSGECTFLMAKSRLAPLRQLSIVRLELQAAVLATRLANTLQEELRLHFTKMVFWSDSRVVLHYLRNDSRRFHTFVANRIAEIRDSSEPCQWRFVPGNLNPADISTRGVSASNLINNEDWPSGPEFLRQPEVEWPHNSAAQPAEDDPEVKTSFSVLKTEVKIHQVLPLPERFSSWMRYRRVVAWTLRFLWNIAVKASPTDTRQLRSGPLTVNEIKDAEVRIIKEAQRRRYAEELEALLEGKLVPYQSQLRQLSPFVDEAGLMRVGGRIDRAPAPYTVRHPVILPPKDAVANLVVDHAHQKVYHSGMERTGLDINDGTDYWDDVFLALARILGRIGR